MPVRDRPSPFPAFWACISVLRLPIAERMCWRDHEVRCRWYNSKLYKPKYLVYLRCKILLPKTSMGRPDRDSWFIIKENNKYFFLFKCFFFFKTIFVEMLVSAWYKNCELIKMSLTQPVYYFSSISFVVSTIISARCHYNILNYNVTFQLYRLGRTGLKWSWKIWPISFTTSNIFTKSTNGLKQI